MPKYWNVIHHNHLREFSVIEDEVELHQPTEEFLKEFRKILEELNYSYETVKAPER
ncbi:hypothetical protein [Desulfurobacterium crinifex]